MRMNTEDESRSAPIENDERTTIADECPDCREQVISCSCSPGEG